jgi:D-tagatose-1,6-bisphosphate aldolase subunit GatZ/KbaZ
MERLMVREPRHWAGYYHGTPEEQRVLRHFGLSDRIRYYWPHPEASAAVDRLLGRFAGRAIPAALLSQYFPALHVEIREGRRAAAPRDLMLATMERAFRPFQAPCAAAPSAG